MPGRTKPLTPWGKEVKKRMLDADVALPELVSAVRSKGHLLTAPKLSTMLSGQLGQRSPEMVEAIEEYLGIHEMHAGRPA